MDKDQEEDILKAYNSNRFFLRSLTSFLVLIILIVTPFKILSYYTSFDMDYIREQIVGSSKSALGSFEAAAQALGRMNPGEAEENFSRANLDLLKAQEQIQDINNILLELSRFAPNEEVRLASVSKEIISAGQSASELGRYLSSAFDVLLSIQESEESSPNALEVIEDFGVEINKALKEAEKINEYLDNIRVSVLPEQYRSDFLALKEKTRAMEAGLRELSVIAEKSLVFLGAERFDKKYLIVFQNSNEIRGSGGFVGSFAKASFKQGELRYIEVPGGGSYDMDGGLTEMIAAPPALQLLSQRWYFRDANWWPDWPTSAKNLMSFYENSGGSTVDGCVAITPEVLGRILEVTGPLDLGEKYGIIDKENFWITIREDIEQEKQSEKPKKIIESLSEEIIDELSHDLSLERIIALFDAIKKSLDAKDIQLYFSNESLQEEVLKRGWGGEMKDTERDYLLVANTNIAGQKSDKNIKQIIDHRADIKEDGSIVNTLKITRIHTGDRSEETYYRARNVNWMRVYVPEGSELLEAKGFEQPGERFFTAYDENINTNQHPVIEEKLENLSYHRPSATRIYPENNKTVFANWSLLDPGEEVVIELKYRLPFKINTESKIPSNWLEKLKQTVRSSPEKYAPYSLLVQRQAGSGGTQFNSVLNWPQRFESAWNYPEELLIRDRGWFISTDLKRDTYWATILKDK